jgi:5'-nucleotidase/UDP-sugar diphosphatase
VKWILLLLFNWNVYAKDIPFTIIHTNDLHSYVGGKGPDSLFTPKQDNDPVFGHYARLTHQIQQVKKQKQELDEAVVMVDAGDFYAGTLFQVIGPDPSIPMMPELEFFIHNKFDVSTLGNHEFDTYEKGLTTMLGKVAPSAGDFKILVSNVSWDKKDITWKKFYSPFTGSLPQGLLTDSLVKEVTSGGKKLKIGFLGIMGPDAAKVSQNNRENVSFIGFNDNKVRVEFDKLYELLQQKVNQLRQKHGANVVVVTMHAGHPEDKSIAENVKGIDVIIAGHTHQLYDVPRWVGTTLITQAECYGKYLGVLPLKWDGKQVRLQNNQPTYITIDDKVPADPEYLAKVKKYEDKINPLIERYGYQYDTPIFKANRSIKRVKKQSHNAVGKLVTTAIKKQYNLNKKPQEDPIDIYFTSLGLVRQDIVSPVENTPYQFSDVFKFMPLGIDANGEPGFPIVTFYLTKAEVRLLINFMEIFKHFSKNFTPSFSDDLEYEVVKWGIPMINRLDKLKLRGIPYEKWPPYLNIATSSYVAGYVDKVGKMTYGVVNFAPKNQEGKEVKEPIKTNYKEFKLLADFMRARGVFPFKN